MAFLLQNYSDHLDETCNRVGMQMTDQWIKFTNGEPWGEPGKVTVIGEEGLITVDEEEYDAKFRDGSGKVLEELGRDRSWKVAEAWQGVRAE